MKLENILTKYLQCGIMSTDEITNLEEVNNGL